MNNLTKKRFDKVYIEIGNICNLQCSFCPEVIRSNELMKLPLFEKIIREVSPITRQVAFHLMGDPLVHPELEHFVQICNEYKSKIFLVTNGVLLREKTAELLLHSAFSQVNFSLHSFSDNYPKLDPTQYLEKIFNFTERAFQIRPDLYINFRIWNLNNPQGSGKQNQDLLDKIEARFGVSVNRLADIRSKKSHLIKGRLYLHFDSEFIWPNLSLPVLGERGRCHGLTSHFGILVDGTVVPCCLDKEGGIPLGNINEMLLTDILDSPKAKKILSGFNSGVLTQELCKRCNYIQRFARQ